MTLDRRTIEDWLEDIIEWGDRAGRHIAGKDFEFFCRHELTQDAVTKCLENIGEAAGNILRLQPDFERQHPQLKLSAAYRARNRISHGYGSINQQIVWITASDSVPEIAAAAKDLLQTRRADT